MADKAAAVLDNEAERTADAKAEEEERAAEAKARAAAAKAEERRLEKVAQAERRARVDRHLLMLPPAWQNSPISNAIRSFGPGRLAVQSAIACALFSWGSLTAIGVLVTSASLWKIVLLSNLLAMLPAPLPLLLVWWGYSWREWSPVLGTGDVPEECTTVVRATSESESRNSSIRLLYHHTLFGAALMEVDYGLFCECVESAGVGRSHDTLLSSFTRRINQLPEYKQSIGVAPRMILSNTVIAAAAWAAERDAFAARFMSGEGLRPLPLVVSTCLAIVSKIECSLVSHFESLTWPRTFLTSIRNTATGMSWPAICPSFCRGSWAPRPILIRPRSLLVASIALVALFPLVIHQLWLASMSSQTAPPNDWSSPRPTYF